MNGLVKRYIIFIALSITSKFNSKIFAVCVVILRPLFRVRTISYKVKPQISRWPFSKRQGLPTNNQKMFHLKYFRNIFFHSFEALENRFLLWKCIFGDNSIQMMIISSLSASCLQEHVLNWKFKGTEDGSSVVQSLNSDSIWRLA